MANFHNNTQLNIISLDIEVLLHASEAPLTATDIKKHLTISNKQLEQALTILQQRLAMGVLRLNQTAMTYRSQPCF